MLKSDESVDRPGTGRGAARAADDRASPKVWIELVVAIVSTVLLVLLMIGFIGIATSSNPGSQAGDLISAVVCLGLVVLCGRWAIHIEHRLRGHTPVLWRLEQHRRGFGQSASTGGF